MNGMVAPAGTKDPREDTVGKLDVVQNRYLRIVAGAYKATPIDVLQAEMMMPPMQKHLDQLQAKAQHALRLAVKLPLYRSCANELQQNCASAEWIRHQYTPGIQKAQWAITITEEMSHTPAAALRPPSW